MSLKFVFAVKRTVAEIALKGSHSAVDHHVHLEILFRPEALLAHHTLKVCCKNTNIPTLTYYGSTSY